MLTIPECPLDEVELADIVQGFAGVAVGVTNRVRLAGILEPSSHVRHASCVYELQCLRDALVRLIPIGDQSPVVPLEQAQRYCSAARGIVVEEDDPPAQ